MKRLLLFASLVLASACDQSTGTASPADTSTLEGMEKGNGATQPGATPAVDADEAAKKAAAEKVLAKVHDRDPEEEKRKLAQAKQRSAQARKMLDGGRYEEAVSNARASLKIHEQNVDAMLVLAEVYFREKKYELTVSVTGTALAVDDKIRTPRETSTAYNLQGFAFASMGQNARATKAFKKAAEADDKNAAAWNNLGTRYLRGGDIKTAAQCFSYAIELAPGFAKAHLNYGAALRGQGKVVEAEKEFLQALKLKKTYPEAYFNLGLLYLDADPFPELSTVQRLNKAILYLEKYKGIATDFTSEPVPKGIGNKKDLAPVSRARADDYIRVAQKGLDRESRAKKREADRGAKSAEGDKEDRAAAGEGADGEAPEDASPQKPGGSSPQKPGGSSPQKPGQPQKPGGSAPQKPGESAKPATEPAKPGATTAKPDAPATTKPSAPTTAKPTAPTTAKPTAPTTAKPTAPTTAKPTAPTTAKPTAPTTAKPTAPTTAKPTAPTTAKPPASPAPTAPQQPGVQKPGAAPTPSKPGVQKPGQKSASAWNPRLRADTKQDGAGLSRPRYERAWRPNVQAVPTHFPEFA